MGKDTRVEWAHHTFNPWWGCTRESEACRNCYAATFANRLGYSADGTKGLSLWGPTARRRFFEERHWMQAFRWDRQAAAAGERHRVFCGSMCDVFENLAPDHPDRPALLAAQRRLFGLIMETPNLDWLLLTKRPQNIGVMVPGAWLHESTPPNLWLGTTVEDQRTANERIPALLWFPARVHFLSCEPLLGPLELSRFMQMGTRCECDQGLDPSERCTPDADEHWIRCNAGTRRINWVIAGGESGGGARPIYPDWARSLRDQCADANVPFFFKQWGAWSPRHKAEDPKADDYRALDGDDLVRLGKKKSGRLRDGREHSEVPNLC